MGVELRLREGARWVVSGMLSGRVLLVLVVVGSESGWRREALAPFVPDADQRSSLAIRGLTQERARGKAM